MTQLINLEDNLEDNLGDNLNLMLITKESSTLQAVNRNKIDPKKQFHKIKRTKTKTFQRLKSYQPLLSTVTH